MADTLSNNFRRENEIIQEVLVNLRKCPAHRALLLDARSAGRFRENTALCKENNMTVRELLLQFTGEPNTRVIV